MQAIQVTGENSFFLRARGAEMTLKKEGERWAMYTVNAAVRAWRKGFAIPKYFDSLQAVEAKYKAWRGIAALAA
ncbi:hypothetical protein [Ralstonia insidiosa]|uniref:Uncharacterized protein n=1 Tax=Ralstonia insidiosa TaxID=190721 RepID=A0A848NVV4_9RALS|nr:hypothetical protein [Ralstonia insidiosa]NMV37215.1 hypothetical protein [Ralstonia insidiosa]